MSKFLLGVVMVLASSSLAFAQSAAPSQTNTSQTNNGGAPAPTAPAAASQPRMAPGSVIPVQLTTVVDAKKAKTGEEVTAKVTQDLKASNGMMLMPKDTEIVGHITEAQAKNKQDKESQVGIVFDHAVMKNGNISYPMSIQAVISPQIFQNPNNGSNGAAEAPSSSTPGQTPGGGARGGMGGGGQGAPPNAAPGGTDSNTSSGGNQAPNITGQTQGVVGFSHLKLDTPSNPAQASVISSEKNNVKLENGTLMLLRVN